MSLQWVIDACRDGGKAPAADELRQALDEIARTPAGRIVLSDLFVEGRLLQPTLVTDDALASAALEGMRRVATRTFNHLVAGMRGEKTAQESET